MTYYHQTTGVGGRQAFNFMQPQGSEPYTADWSRSLCMPGDGCLESIFCHYCMYGYITARLKNDVGGTHFCNEGCYLTCILDVCSFCAGSVFTCQIREGVRFRYKIKGDMCNSCCVSCFCPCCSAAQLVHEMARHNERPETMCTRGQPVNDEYRATDQLQLLTQQQMGMSQNQQTYAMYMMMVQQQQGQPGFQQQPGFVHQPAFGAPPPSFQPGFQSQTVQHAQPMLPMPPPPPHEPPAFGAPLAGFATPVWQQQQQPAAYGAPPQGYIH